MIDCITPHFEAYREAIIKVAERSPELVPLHALSCSLSDLADVLAAFLADGNAGALVLVAGRAFAGEVLEVITGAEDYELCVALREAINDGTSLYDAEGTPSKNFCTPAYEALMQEAGKRQAEAS